MSTVAELREKGNVAFREQSYFEAERCYSAALENADETSDPKILAIINTNLAFTYLKIEQYQRSLDCSSKAIELDQTYAKAYVRRAQAYFESQNFKDSYNACLQALKISPGLDPAGKRFARELAEKAKAKHEDKKARYIAAMSPRDTDTIDPSPPARPKTPAWESKEEPVFNAEYAKSLMEDLFNDNMPTTHVVNLMLTKLSEMMKPLPNIVHLNYKPGSIRVVGDTHGQYQDLYKLFKTYGFPSSDNPYLFNGDYVDRGSMGVEILLALFAWKIAIPDSVFLNRGNHETNAMNSLYGFESECNAKFKGLSPSMFSQFSNFFNTLPLGHILNDRVLIVHGGLFSDQTITIDDLQTYDRFRQPPESGPLNDILWSDPMEQDGFAPSPRGVTRTFGPDVTKKFLSENNLEILIRSHQVQERGYCEMHDGKCITVFSAPRYIGQMNNLGATVHLVFAEDGTIEKKDYDTFTAEPIITKYPPMKYAAFPQF